MILPARSTDMSLKQGQNKTPFTSNFCVFERVFMLQQITGLYTPDAKLKKDGKQTEKYVLDRAVQRFWVQGRQGLGDVFVICE